uniref:ribonuclease H n=1 Tax=Xenopus tropicalis TaxID=8364 RepID=A0A803JSC3_XENTR
MSLMGWPLEIRYKQDTKNPVAQGLAELHDCINVEHKDESPENDFLEEQSLSPYKSYEEEYCKSLPCVYVDGCSFHTEEAEKMLVAGIGIVWNNVFPEISTGYKIGSKSSQVAELAAVYKAVQMAIEYDIKEFVLITDSDYVRNSFVEYFPGWKRSNMMRSTKMPSKMIAILYAVLILGKELHAELIVMPGPSSGIMLQDTAGFIMTNKRILSQKIYMSLDPRC